MGAVAATSVASCANAHPPAGRAPHPAVVGIGVWRFPCAVQLWRAAHWVSQHLAALLASAGLLHPSPRPVWVELEERYGLDCTPPPDPGSRGASPVGAAAAAGGRSAGRLALLRGGFSDAVAAARAHGRLLLVYLHSPLHQDTPSWCSHTLGDPAVQQVIADNYLVWAESVHTAEGSNAATNLFGAIGFPFVAAVYLRPRGDRKEEVLLRVEGPSEPGLLAYHLGQCAEAAAPLLAAQRRERFAAAARSRLREEQDAAFTRSQQIDAEREQQRAREVAEQLRREIAEQEARLARQRAEEEERRQQEEARLRQEAEFRAAQAARRQQLPPPPPPDEHTGVCTLRITLPGGRVEERRFRATDTVQAVRDYVFCHESYDGRPFGICTRMPQQALPLSATLQDAGLCPRAVVVAAELAAGGPPGEPTPLRPAAAPRPPPPPPA
eukprot:TRINITY_DN55067_c0_g1_i1.p2 TRINITY_DN55067_c0_g1~~TRINITY_DN55067_c0_g1_i1.p2  ORF type:complete len:484 (+),score=162.33 TRINITY_DN55067_c0_g1_i1:138-1454(+)